MARPTGTLVLAVMPRRVLAAALTACLGACVVMPYPESVPAARRADAVPRLDTPTFVVDPPAGTQWAVDAMAQGYCAEHGATTPARLANQLQALGAPADEVVICRKSWWSLWTLNSGPVMPVHWRLSILSFRRPADTSATSDSMRTVQLADSIRAAEREGHRLSSDDLSIETVALGAARWQVLSSVRAACNAARARPCPPHWPDLKERIALRVDGDLVLVAILAGTQSPDSVAERLLASLVAVH